MNLNEENILKLFNELFPDFEINLDDKEKYTIIRKYIKNNNDINEKNIDKYNFSVYLSYIFIK